MPRVLYQDTTDDTRVPEAPPEPTAFHLALDGYQPTPLLDQPQLAAAWHVASVDVKLETYRFGLSSFKVLGASWAAVMALRPHLPPEWSPRAGLRGLAGALPSLVLVAATDGNHGRAVAWVARRLGLSARIFVPASLPQAAVAGIAGDGAEVIRVQGTYDAAVQRSADDGQRPDHVLVSDMSWPGYERVAQAAIDGYATILREIDWQLAERRRPAPDLVVVQLGVGAFGAAVIGHFRSKERPHPRIVGVEPTSAACVMASLAAGRPLTIPGPQDSVATGLNCGTPSLVAWPVLQCGLDGVLALDDELVLAGVNTLAAAGTKAGACAGIAVSAARELLAGEVSAHHRARLGLSADASVLLFATEGATHRSCTPA